MTYCDVCFGYFISCCNHYCFFNTKFIDCYCSVLDIALSSSCNCQAFQFVFYDYILISNITFVCNFNGVSNYLIQFCSCSFCYIRCLFHYQSGIYTFNIICLCCYWIFFILSFYSCTVIHCSCQDIGFSYYMYCIYLYFCAWFQNRNLSYTSFDNVAVTFHKCCIRVSYSNTLRSCL